VLPSEVITELSRLTQEILKGYEALHEAEKELAQADLDLDTVEQKAFLAATGTVADRTALARLESAENRFSRDLARAKVNRIKTKIKAVESAMTASQTIARLIDTERRI